MTRSKWTFWKALLAGLLCLAHGAAGNVGATSPAQSRGIVFVADGAGAQGGIVDGLAQQTNDANLPLYVQQFNWSTLNEGTDFQSQYNFRMKGRQLAHRILEMRKTCPDAKIYLVGFGAGTTVVLYASEWLPPNTVNRTILLAPAVSCSYDLRRALLASCEGIDSFYSPEDKLLRHAIYKYGTTDIGIKGATSAAGLNGFQSRIGSSTDAALYAKLRQRPLVDPICGNLPQGGGHVNYLRPAFLRPCVVSLLEASLLNPNPCPPYGWPSPCPAPQPAPTPYSPPPYAPAPYCPIPPYTYPRAPQPPAPYQAPPVPGLEYPRAPLPPTQCPAPRPQYPSPYVPYSGQQYPQIPPPQFPPAAPRSVDSPSVQIPPPNPGTPGRLPTGPQQLPLLPPLPPPAR